MTPVSVLLFFDGFYIIIKEINVLQQISVPFPVKLLMKKVKPMDDLILIEPTVEYKEQAMDYRDSYIRCGETHINGSLGFMRYEDYESWLKEVQLAHNKESSPIGVPATTYFTVRISDGKIIGTVQLRHELNDYLIKRGGNIGYGIRPEERRKGYGTKQLSLVLEKARELGIPQVMISCDKNNLGSACVALNNGAKLTWEGFDEEDGDIKIFWIDLL